MDSISRYEFHEIFDRVSMYIDLTGCISALAIEQALVEARGRSKAKSKISRTDTARARHGRRAELLDNLIENDFAGRAVYEARANPTGSIALTLRYGRQEARRIIAQRRTAQRKRLAYPTIPRKSLKVPKKPWFRRIPTHR